MSHWEPLWLSVDHAGVSGSWLLWMFRGTYYGKPSHALGPPHQRADIPVRSTKRGVQSLAVRRVSFPRGLFAVMCASGLCQEATMRFPRLQLYFPSALVARPWQRPDRLPD